MKTLTFTERDSETEEQEKLENKQARARAEYFAELLAPYLAAQFGYKRNHVTLGLGATVNAKTAKYDLYFRVTPPRGLWKGSDCLVIARIEFKPARKGHGRRFMTFLVECADHIGYSKIGIESTNDESEAFGGRFGLQQHGDGNNLLGTVDEVRTRLAEQST